MSSLRGRLLVATPVIGDPNFDRTVVLLLDHGDEGALGLVLNRPTEVAVVDPLPEWGELAAVPSVVFVGGPVDQQAAIGLARLQPGGAESTAERPATPPPPPDEAATPIVGPIGTLDLSRHPLELEVAVDEVRVFAGYSGWGPGQLEAELGADAWCVVDPEPDDILSGEPDELWSVLLRRQGGALARLSYYPPDPSVN